MTTVESKLRLSVNHQVHEIDLENVSGADVKLKIADQVNVALVDTGAACSCMSEETHRVHGSGPLKSLFNINVRSASGTNLEPMGVATYSFTLGNKCYTQPFVVCRRLTRSIILGRDFLKTNKLHVGWSKQGKFQVQAGKDLLIEAITTESHPVITMKKNVIIPPRTLIVAEMQVTIPDMEGPSYYDFTPTERYLTQGINLVIVPEAYYTGTSGKQVLLQVLINLDEQPVKIPQGTNMGHLKDMKETASLIETPSTNESICDVELQESGEFWNEMIHDASPEGKKFIASPADIEIHREIKLKDADVESEQRQQFEDLCNEFEDVFLKDSTDLGRTPLLTMNIDMGDHPPVTQRPYSLALKHVERVQEEIKKLEQAGVISRSMSPWASPIVIVPKKTAPGEPPRRRMCMDYRMVNSLAPPVIKAHSKAKGILTFVPLPKIDEIFAKLRGSQIYSTFDMRSGYYHLELRKEAQAKTAFVIGGPIGGKWEFKVCPFGLTQAPAYFQRLVHQVLEGLPFAFGYLDDILIFSETVEEHLRHVRTLF